MFRAALSAFAILASGGALAQPVGPSLEAVRDCASVVAEDRSCLLRFSADAIAQIGDARAKTRIVTAAAADLAKRGRIDAAARLFSLTEDPEQWRGVDKAVLEHLVGAGRLDAAEDYLDAIPAQGRDPWLAEGLYVFHLTNAYRPERPFEALNALERRISDANMRFVIRQIVIENLAFRGHLDEALAQTETLFAERESFGNDALLPEAILGVSPGGLAVGYVIAALLREGKVDEALRLTGRLDGDRHQELGIRSGFRRIKIEPPELLLEYAENAPSEAIASIARLAAVEAMIASGRLEAARELLHLVSGAERKSGARGLAIALVRADRLADARALREEVGLRGAGEVELLRNAVRAAIGRGEVRRAQEIIATIEHDRIRWRVIDDATWALVPRRNRTDENLRIALDLVKQIDVEDVHSTSLLTLIWRLDPDEVEIVLSSGFFNAVELRKRALGIRLGAAANVKDWPRVEALFSEADAVQRRYAGFFGVARQSLSAGKLELALRIAPSIEDPRHRDSIFQAVAEAYAERGEAETAILLLHEIAEPEKRANLAFQLWAMR